jgi:hypothetical protein
LNDLKDKIKSKMNGLKEHGGITGGGGDEKQKKEKE